ncbi:MAG: formate dehydrogenase subunit gamma [Hyphomicrobiaceae bacterium]
MSRVLRRAISSTTSIAADNAQLWSALAIAIFAMSSVVFYAGSATAQSSVRPPANATINVTPRTGTPQNVPGRPDVAVENLQKGNVPGGSLGNRSHSDTWRKLREGEVGSVSIPDSKAGQTIRGTPTRLRTEADVREAMARQNAGPQPDAILVSDSIASWVDFRKGPLAQYGLYAMGGMLVLLILFFLLRGRIKVDHGLSGQRILRFGSIERLGHWLLAISFIVLALTGLNLLYGRQFLIPLFGPETYATVAFYGKLSHNYVGFAFMAGLVLCFINWVWYNFPHPRDVMWLLKGGGLFVKGVHPSSRKFNAGQKILFWLVMLGGVSISLSGLALMFPFETAMFEKTFVFLNSYGFNLPTGLSPIQEMQYQSIWHAVMALFLICVILAHIYIGSVGMQGAIDAMTTGEVDINWAKEHHDLWVKDELAKGRAPPSGASVQPAE